MPAALLRRSSVEYDTVFALLASCIAVPSVASVHIEISGTGD
jgi:hypothetical protein